MARVAASDVLYGDPMTLQIVMHEAFPQGDVDAVRGLAREYDAEAEVSASYVTKAVDPVLIILVFIGGSFAQGFFTRAGEDAYESLRRLIVRLREAVTAESQILIEDDGALQLMLSPSTPADALLDLPADVRAAAGEAGSLYWDEQEGRWEAPPSF